MNIIGTSLDEGGAILLSELIVYNNRENLFFIDKRILQVANSEIMCYSTI